MRDWVLFAPGPRKPEPGSVKTTDNVSGKSFMPQKLASQRQVTEFRLLWGHLCLNVEDIKFW